MRVILHAGMNKTGSSSIQQTFANQRFPEVDYVNWRSHNHSGMVSLLFESAPENSFNFRDKGRDRAYLLAERDEWTKKLAAQLEAGKDRCFLLSAELISSPLSDAVPTMADFFARFTDDIRVIAYVRPPISFMQSAFQQRVRGGQAQKLRPAGLWPDYRKRFEKLDTAFGRERVTLKKFTPDALLDGDVVHDFAREIGVTLDPTTAVRTNVAVSLEALALLFAQRKLGDGYVRGIKGAAKGNRRFLAALENVGTQKFAFAPSLTAPTVKRFRDDLQWMEARLGEPLLDTPRTGTVRQIASEEDLLAVAEENQDKVEKLLIDLIQENDPKPYGRLVRNLDLLRKLYY